ncbi:hypothetical protein NDU88_000674 [Pleurodeles waltl]|uniref:Uncharacterized protein n=1 Tax=Pleurodeles waltl TaxID=8319 RepID=A0AAV7S7M5_PLEWA|nr:hypothetical protein NDU88_000674 [Pleurodeles waltl]
MLPSSPQLQGQTTPDRQQQDPNPPAPGSRRGGTPASAPSLATLPRWEGGQARCSAPGPSRATWLRAEHGCLWCPTAAHAHCLGRPPPRPVPPAGRRRAMRWPRAPIGGEKIIKVRAGCGSPVPCSPGDGGPGLCPRCFGIRL